MILIAREVIQKLKALFDTRAGVEEWEMVAVICICRANYRRQEQNKGRRENRIEVEKAEYSCVG